MIDKGNGKAFILRDKENTKMSKAYIHGTSRNN